MSDFDYGQLADLMRDEEIRTIWVNNPEHVYVWHKRKGYQAVNVAFDDASHLVDFAQSLANADGKTLDARNPIADVRLPNGASAKLFVSPVATNGAVVQILKPIVNQMTMERLVAIGGTSQAAADFLTACVRARLNIAVVGGYSSGKTTFLNVLADEIPEPARIIVIQSVGTLSLKQPDTVILETRKADINGEGAITNRHLLEHTLDLNPHRIILAELDRTESATLLNAMDLGHHVMFAMSGSGARDALARLEDAAVSSNLATPLLTIREQLARTLDVIVHVELFELGDSALKRMMGVAEVRGMKGDSIDLAQLFERRRDRDELLTTGEMSQLLNKIQARGVDIDESLFSQ